MGYARPVETDDVTLPSDPQWVVTLKREALYADEQRAEITLAFAVAGEEQGRTERLTDFVRARTLTMIVEWNLTDTDGSPLPVNAASLDLLNKADGAFLMNEARKRYEGRSDEEAVPFGKRSGTRSRATASTTKTPSVD